MNNNFEPFMYWHNFDTEQTDAIQGTPKNLEPYIPQGLPRNLYHLYLETGESPLDAMCKVLKQCVEKEIDTVSTQDLKN